MFFLLINTRAKTKSRSDSLFRYTIAILLISSFCDNAVTCVSALRAMVRDKCKIDDINVPPGNMKLVNSDNSDSKVSISFYNDSIMFSVVLIFVSDILGFAKTEPTIKSSFCILTKISFNW